MKLPLDRIEARIQAFIEGSLGALLSRENPRSLLAHELVEAMQTHLTVNPDQTLTAPDAYLLLVAPGEGNKWLTDADLLTNLANVLSQTGQETGIQFQLPPSLRLQEDPSIAAGQFKIVPDLWKGDDSDHTASIRIDSETPAVTTAVPASAYLIVNGGEIFPLDRPVISIGRRTDNQLVLSDMRVSRTHAMLRVINGQFFVFDLNSLGGTLLNGKRITQAALRPGDVITLAGVPLIYGQDIETGPNDLLDQTQVMEPEIDHDAKKKHKP